jgi:hypothetical protein
MAEFEGREIAVGDVVTIRKAMKPMTRDLQGFIPPLDAQRALDSLVKAGWEIVTVEPKSQDSGA